MSTPFGDHDAIVVVNIPTCFEENGNTTVLADINGNITAGLQMALHGINLNLHGGEFCVFSPHGKKAPVLISTATSARGI